MHTWLSWEVRSVLGLFATTVLSTVNDNDSDIADNDIACAVVLVMPS